MQTNAENSALNAVMSSIKTDLGYKLENIIGSREVVYVDYPVHGNTGDLLILAGALQFFKEKSIKIQNYDNIYAKKFTELKRTSIDTPIVCHGGGNFGDLYPGHQKFREELVSELSQHRIVAMPQSMHFSSNEAMERSAAIFRKHRNFHFCVRDKESYDFAHLFTDNVHLLPDCAHMLWGKFKPALGGDRHMKFLRKDIESTGISNSESVDWATLSDPGFYKTQNFMQKLTKKVSRKPSTLMSKAAFQIWMIEVRRTINDAYGHFSTVDVVETDRLHGMIFSLLLQKKVIFNDNLVKKLSRYKNTWLENLSGTWIVEANRENPQVE